MRRFTRGARGGSRKRKVDWGSAQVDVFGIGPSQKTSAYIFRPTDVRNFFVSPTVLAIRSFLNCILTSGAVSPLPAFVGVGIIRWTDRDDIAPVGNDVPGVLTDGNMDWMARWVFPFPATTQFGTLGNANIFDITHLSKAKRKLENTAGLLWCVETSLGVGVAHVAADHRFLVQQV